MRRRTKGAGRAKGNIPGRQEKGVRLATPQRVCGCVGLYGWEPGEKDAAGPQPGYTEPQGITGQESSVDSLHFAHPGSRLESSFMPRTSALGRPSVPYSGHTQMVL